MAKRSQRSYQLEIKKLRSLLSQVEFVRHKWNGYPECPFCGMYEGNEHEQDCEWFRVMEERRNG